MAITFVPSFVKAQEILYAESYENRARVCRKQAAKAKKPETRAALEASAVKLIAKAAEHRATADAINI